LLRGLPGADPVGQGDIAQMAFRIGGCREGQHIGRASLAPELLIQGGDRPIIGEQDTDRTEGKAGAFSL